MKRLPRILLSGLAALAILCLALVGILALSNRSLPVASQATNRLSAVDKARLAESTHLRRSLGDSVWPGWSGADIPVIISNEEYAFLVGYPADPPPGWVRMPQNEARGAAWEAVPGDAFEGNVYYRQRLPDPQISPENFTVLVGERWVATMYSKEHMEISFYAGLRQELPAFIRPIFPFRLAWGLLMDETDRYIGALEHEAFHAFQGIAAPERLADAEFANRSSSRYPWENDSFADAWVEEADLMVGAVRAQTTEQAAGLARQFLARRDQRRAAAGLAPDLVDYERQREWLEGLAKYAELNLVLAAASTPAYAPLPAVAEDPKFREYAAWERYWDGQLDEVRRTAGREGETRFYYSGLAQAVLLDRLAPGWKEQVFAEGVFLEDLLRQAVR